MRIRFNATEPGKYTKGDEADVSETVGNELVCAGVAEVVSRGEPPVNTLKSVIVKNESAMRAKLEAESDDAEQE